MRAALLEKYGGMDAVKVGETDRPEPAANEVQIEVYAASVNPFDVKVRDGAMKDSLTIKFPLVLGGDVAGIVSSLGEGVTEFSVGEEVYGQAGALKQGSLAEYTVVNISQLSVKPNLNTEEAAALPLTASSAYQALHEHLKLTAGQKILIHGGGGGIGSLAIQLAKDIGTYVATTVSSKDRDYVTQLGADKVIDYKSEDFSELISNYDCVFDTVGGETFTKSYQVVRPGGKLVSMAAGPDHSLEGKYDVISIHQSTKVTPEVLEAITKLVNDHKLKPNIDKVFPLDKAPEALEYLKVGHPRGKVIVTVKT